MTHTFASWTAPTAPFMVIDVSTEEGWASIRKDYAHLRPDKSGSMSRQLERVIGIAEELGVVSVLIEYRYVDADWRSEHMNFYGSTFARHPSVCHRLHFFAEPVTGDLVGLDSESVRQSYRGYSVMRPLPETRSGARC